MAHGHLPSFLLGLVIVHMLRTRLTARRAPEGDIKDSTNPIIVGFVCFTTFPLDDKYDSRLLIFQDAPNLSYSRWLSCSDAGVGWGCFLPLSSYLEGHL